MLSCLIKSFPAIPNMPSLLRCAFKYAHRSPLFTKNNQHNSSTQPHSQPRTMSEGAMANSVAADSAAPARLVAPDSAAPARVVAAVTAARTPVGTKKSLPVTAAERVWKTKRPYQRRQKKSSVPARLLWRLRPSVRLASPSIRVVLSSRS